MFNHKLKKRIQILEAEVAKSKVDRYPFVVKMKDGELILLTKIEHKQLCEAINTQEKVIVFKNEDHNDSGIMKLSEVAYSYER